MLRVGCGVGGYSGSISLFGQAAILFPGVVTLVLMVNDCLRVGPHMQFFNPSGGCQKKRTSSPNVGFPGRQDVTCANETH